MKKISTNFKNQDILSLDQFDKKSIKKLFLTIDKIKKLFSSKRILNLLKGKIITLLFFEPSSRTFASFSSACKRLGGQTIEYQNPLQTSSTIKGESFSDTIQVFEQYCDLIIMRHPETGAAKKAADIASVPVVNAGDGSGEHPTQTLLDLYTVYEKFGRLNNLVILIGGDLLYGRTVHSLLKGLSIYKNNLVYLLSPKNLCLPKELFNEIKNREVKLIEIYSENDIPRNCDFWYWTRVQKERFSNIDDYEKVKNKFVITPELLEKKGNQKMIIMHPLPRVGEITIEVDKDPRAYYLRCQIKNGLLTRMALLSLIFGKK